MEKWIEKYRGINPGAILDRELKKKKLKQTAFARDIKLPAQTLNAIIKGKRKMTPEVAFKIDNALGLEESTMAILQAMYDTTLVKHKIGIINRPDISRLRRILFWDTDFDKIDWQRQKNAVIRRVWERGNEDEKKEIQRFYGIDSTYAVINEIKPNRPDPSFLRKKSS
ncbi:transcriptional regulator [Mucilaginibacter sp. AW1-7]|uniref:helix-turn-helix transcriptional regulator n=1 Tax=Mucilaginibacter sp. AW1-7 TaxID=3349874 RepID=UPI003F73D479